MDGTADKSTPLWMPWREALKRAGSFDALRPYLHTGQIPAHHGGLYALSDSNQHSGPGILRPEKWAHAYEDRAGRRVIFITDEVVFGQLVREQVFAYASGIELDSAAFDTFFPVAGLPPAEQAHPRPLTPQAELPASPPAPAPDGPPQAEAQYPAVMPAVDPPAQDAPRRGRPSSAELVLVEAERRLKVGDVPAARKEFLDQLSNWLSDRHPEARPTAAKTIGDHLSKNENLRALMPKHWRRRT